MLAILSFIFLGIWTTILGFINNSNKPENQYFEKELNRSKQITSTANSKVTLAATDSLNQSSSSETLLAFESLWKEIFYGF